MNEVVVRRMNALDIDAVWQVEYQSFSTPWSRQAFVDEMKHDLSYYLVMVKDNTIVGYGGMWLVVDEAHITNIAILPAYRGIGMGKILMTSLVEQARSKGMASMTLEVRVTNQVAQQLYAQFGFKPGGRRRNYYTDTNEDALIMWCIL